MRDIEVFFACSFACNAFLKVYPPSTGPYAAWSVDDFYQKLGNVCVSVRALLLRFCSLLFF